MSSRITLALLVAVATIVLTGGAAPLALAQGHYDTPTLTLGGAGLARQTITITAGSTGAPAGFTICWMKRSDFTANRSVWLPGDPRQGQASFTGKPTLNVFPGEAARFALGPNESITVQIGDLADESGVTVSDWRSSWGGELESGTEYVFCAFANPGATVSQSGFTATFESATIQAQNCTFTQGYWRNHPEAWPPSCLPMTLGSNAYTQAELLQILDQPVDMNGAVSLAQQLIATKLNLCMGSDPEAVSACVSEADALLSGCGANRIPPHGSCFLAPTTTSATTECLDSYNNGITGPGSCPVTPGRKTSWGELKVMHR